MRVHLCKKVRIVADAKAEDELRAPIGPMTRATSTKNGYNSGIGLLLQTDADRDPRIGTPNFLS
jgi:hypothetical protein